MRVALTPAQASYFVRVSDAKICPGTLSPVYTIRDPARGDDDTYVHAGFYVLPGALDGPTQRLLAHKCLTKFAESPPTTNLQPLGQEACDSSVAGVGR